MARTTHDTDVENQKFLFAVTREVVIGHVVDGGDMHPLAAALHIIGEEFGEGLFRFPMPDGKWATVEITISETR